MAGLSVGERYNYLRRIVGGAILPQISRHWIGLHTDEPGDGTQNEVPAITGYIRVEGTGKWNILLAGEAYNSMAIVFAVATSPYTVTHYSLWNISSTGNAGNCYFTYPLSKSVDVATGQSFEFGVNALVLFPSTT